MGGCTTPMTAYTPVCCARGGATLKQLVQLVRGSVGCCMMPVLHIVCRLIYDTEKNFLETLRFFVYSFVAVLVEFVDMCLPVGWPGGRPHCTAPASQPEKLGPETS